MQALAALGEFHLPVQVGCKHHQLKQPTLASRETATMARLKLSGHNFDKETAETNTDNMSSEGRSRGATGLN